VSNEEKDPTGSAEAARESERVRQFLDAGIAHDPRVSPSVMRGAEDTGPSETVNEDGSWKSHALEEKSDAASQPRGGLRRTLRRWFRR
jgi:hypothetical protein